MSLENLIEQYGYFALFIGTLLEGETIMLIAGFVAHQSYLNIYFVIFIGFIGTFICDQFFFFLGRHKGQTFLEKHPSWQGRMARVDRLFQQRQKMLIISFRFFYGFRTVTPFFIGMSSKISIIRFMSFNLIGAMIWAITFATIGYYSGHTLEYLLHDIKHLEAEIIALLALLGCIAWLIHAYRRHKSAVE